MSHLLKILLTPSFWIRSARTDHSWDQTLNDLIDKKEPVRLTPLSSGLVYITNLDRESQEFYSLLIGDYKIWVALYPFSYGNLYGEGSPISSGLPSRKTVFKLREYINLNKQKLLDDLDKFKHLYKTDFKGFVKESIEYYRRSC